MALSAGTCFFGTSGTEIGSFEESCGGSVNASSNSTDSAATTTMSRSIDSNNDAATPTAAASSTVGEPAFPTAAASSTVPESETAMPTSPSLQANPTSAAKSLGASGKFVDTATQAFVVMGGVGVIWGMI